MSSVNVHAWQFSLNSEDNCFFVRILIFLFVFQLIATMSKKIKSHKKKLRDEEDESDEEEEEIPVKSRKQQKERSNKLFPFSYFSGEYILRPMITGAALAFGLSIGKSQINHKISISLANVVNFRNQNFFSSWWYLFRTFATSSNFKGYTIYDFFAANLKPWLFHGLSALGFIKRASLQ